MSFLRSAGPGLIVAEAWIERMGNSTAFLEGHIKNEKGDVLAKASSTVRLVPMKRTGQAALMPSVSRLSPVLPPQ